VKGLQELLHEAVAWVMHTSALEFMWLLGRAAVRWCSLTSLCVVIECDVLVLLLLLLLLLLLAGAACCAPVTGGKLL
jgi:hypothetical protein